MAEVLGQDQRLNLILGQPLEVLETLVVGLEISLAGHDAAFHEESLLAQKLDSSLLIHLGLPVVVNVVANRVVADHPGVHVDTSRLGEGSFSSLG